MDSPTPLFLDFKGISLLFSIDGEDLPSLCFLKNCTETRVYLYLIGELFSLYSLLYVIL
jgi:hypothetical protein